MKVDGVDVSLGDRVLVKLPPFSGASKETLEKRASYGGRKAKSALRRLKRGEYSESRNQIYFVSAVGSWA